MDELTLVKDAIAYILGAKTSSVSTGGSSLTRLPIEMLFKRRDELEAKVAQQTSAPFVSIQARIEPPRRS